MVEIFLENGRLLPMEKWEQKISSLRAEVQEYPVLDDAGSVKAVADSVSAAVKSRIPEGKFGIMFSGGVDSALIAFLCKKFGGEFTCYTVGFVNSRDIVAARKAAELMGLELKEKVYSEDEIEKIISEVLPVIGRNDVVNASVAAVAYAAILLAREDGINALFSGLGSEEIFGGYQRHADAADINAECWKGLGNMWQRDLVRDCRLASHEGVSFLTPFLDQRLIQDAMRVPGNLKIDSLQKKIILRKAALSLGLPRQIAFRKKIAAQYGSGFDSAIEKLSRKKGLMKSEFVKSLIRF